MMRTFRFILTISLLALFASSCREETYSQRPPAADSKTTNKPSAGGSFVAPTVPGSVQDYGAMHSALQKIFDHVVVVGDGYSRVVYQKLLEADLINWMNEYDAGLKKINIEDYLGSSRDDQDRAFKKAFWLNFYNACVLRIVRDHLEEIHNRDQSSRCDDDGLANSDACGLNGLNLWKEPLCIIGPEGKLSLNQAENAVLRNGEERNLLPEGDERRLPSSIQKRNQDFFDHRLHYGLNCASGSCPMLAPKIFTSLNVEELLSDLEWNFWNRGKEAVAPYRSQMRSVDAGIEINPIFSWFSDDFPNLLTSLRKLVVDPSLRTKLQAISDGDLYEFSRGYNWRLNEAALNEWSPKRATIYTEMIRHDGNLVLYSDQ